jgi:hypothetical protein
MSNTKWVLSALAVIGITVALVVIGLDLTSADPLAGVQAVAIEGIEGKAVPELKGIADPVSYGLNVALGDRGILIDGQSPDATLRINVDKFTLDLDSGLQVVAYVDVTKKNGEKHSMVFRIDATIQPEIKFHASLKKR